MGRYTLFNDFLTSKTPSNFEVLQGMRHLGNDDDRLLVPALFYLEWWNRSTRSMDSWVKEEIEETKSTRFSAVQMIELNLSLRKVRGHSYNIYEYSFLSISESGIDVVLLCVAAFSLIAQISLLIILIYHNWGNITSVASWRVFWKAGFPTTSTCINKVKMLLRMLLLGINIFVNGGLGVVIVVFNFFFLIISNDVNDAIVNSLALFFIIEMDDALKPKWGDVDFDDRFAQNLFHCIDNGGDVQVEIISQTNLIGNFLADKD
eukprot:scaffold323_cov74-Skeletonema_dohrnii-CCMP3373.AAC.9